MTSSQIPSMKSNSPTSCRSHQTKLILLFIVLILVSLACDMNSLAIPGAPQATSTQENGPGSEISSSSLPPLPESVVNFRVTLPANTPAGTTIYLNVLDEVTGLALNSTRYPMQVEDITAPLQVYTLSLPFKLGSAVLYRYERQVEAATAVEHGSAGSPVRYRIYHVEGPGTIEDVVSRWTDTQFDSLTGRIMGQALDQLTGDPIPNLLVAAGGQQTFTASDGSFLLEGLPPGVHNLVGFALDGNYQTFQQGAQVAAESTTPATINMTPAPLVDVVFVVRLPADTPPVIPVRLAGSLYQLGNTFANLQGGVSSQATKMPVLAALPDGRYTLTLRLPSGADIRYKYTLGDGLWNAEHRNTGEFRVRQLVVPAQNTLVEDVVETWHTGGRGPITFDVLVPQETPASDSVSIQFNPIFGWTEPVPMWRLGENRWAYILYSPLNLPGDLGYRYCRNDQCGRADDASTAGEEATGRRIAIQEQPQTIKDQVAAWAGFDPSIVNTEAPSAQILPRAAGFVAGIEFEPAYRPSWNAHMGQALDKAQAMGANWVFLTPTWTYTRNSPPVLEPVAGMDPLWYDLVDISSLAPSRGLNLAVYPIPDFQVNTEEWWQSATRDFSWWLVWFEHYRNFALHHADLATHTGAGALVLGGDWLDPALPNGTLADGSPSGVPADAEFRWRELLSEVRSHFTGELIWALPYRSLENPPAFLDSVDRIYLLWSVPLSEQPGAAQADLEAEAARLLDSAVAPIQSVSGKPLILGVSYPSIPDLQAQYNAYHAMFTVLNQRDWVSGFVTRGFYPPAAMQDNSPSIHGKLAESLFEYWFPSLTTIPAP